MLEQTPFLQAACRNVQKLLESVLRFEYATHINAAVFSTLQTRVSSLEKKLESAEIQGLSAIAADLGRVAEVISQAEKSHLGEISWAFVTHFAKLAEQACEENPAPSLNDSAQSDDASKKTREDVEKLNKVHFFFSSNGNLYTYRLHREKRGHDQGGAKIFNLQFPRAFKESVLLHGLLAHELGHALIDINRGIWIELIQSAFSNSPLALESGFELNKTDEDLAPQSAQDWVIGWSHKQTKVTRSDVKSITEEVFCDVVGLILMGPAFIFALAQLLWAIEPLDQGLSQLPTYPSFKVRLQTLLEAAKVMDWDKLVDPGAWEKLNAYGLTQAGNGKVLLSTDEVKSLVNMIKKKLPSTVWFGAPNRSTIDAAKLDLWDRIPPNVITAQVIDGTLSVKKIEIDFRDFLLAAWEVASLPLPEDSELKKRTKNWQEAFLQINQLSEKALGNLLAAKLMNEAAS